MRIRRLRHTWLMVPGVAVALFALSAMVLPVGSDGLGAALGNEPGIAPALARWARDIHDGFWQPKAKLISLASAYPVPFVSTTEHSRARDLCRRGLAEEAIDLYQRIGVRSMADHEALFELNEWLIVNGDYDRCEWYAREADRLLDSGILRNNLAWHYTQTDQRHQQALDLALMSVAEHRNACNVDTLAWAYYRCGERDVARSVAHETLEFATTWASGLSSWEENEAKESSRELLSLLDGDAQAQLLFSVPAEDFDSQPGVLCPSPAN